MLYPNEPIYNIGAKIEIIGKLDYDNFKKAYHKLIDQHDSYRSIFYKEDAEVKVRFYESQKSELGFLDFSNSEKPIEEANEYMQNEFIKPFDLLGGEFLHIFTLIKVADHHHFLFSVYHHIITDGWGTSLMFQRLVKNYNELSENGTIISEYPFSYKDFMEDDLNYQKSQEFEDDKNYWTEKFKFLPENVFNKIDQTKTINSSLRSSLVINRELYNQLNDLSKDFKISTFHLILSCLFIYIGKKNNKKDFAIGLPVLNRSKSIFKKTVGLFMGVSPLRIQLDFDQKITVLFESIKNQLRHDYRHQRFPLGKLINELQAFREKELIFNITLSYEKQDYSCNFANTNTKVIPLTHQSERVALAIYIREFDDLEDVIIDFDYNINYFTNQEINQFVGHFKNLVEDLINNPNKTLNEIDFIPKEEKIKILHKFNDTQKDFNPDNLLLELIENQVKLNPNKIAIKDDVNQYSYYELNSLTNQIANYIIHHFNDDNQDPIGLIMNRSANMVVFLIGILKTGRSYIPLDPTFPSERLDYIIQNGGIKILISDDHHSFTKRSEITYLSTSKILNEINDFDELKKDVLQNDTAYIIYTSGSTGNPKGVEISHAALANFLISIVSEPGIHKDDLLFSVTTYSFDISILEFFAPLIVGATVYITSNESLRDPKLIINKLNEIKPTIIQATPSFYQMLCNANWSGNNKLKILCGGDLLSETLLEKLIENSCEVWNMYGPTETTIWSTTKRIESPSDCSNIGKPINNTKIYILDEQLNMQSIGSCGSIYIGGKGLAKGYFKNQILTNQKFIPNPLCPDELIYETGDIGQWLFNGDIKFLGRNDNQVKVRGYRIELAEIEHKLTQIDNVQDAVVIAKKEQNHEDCLIAYLIGKDEVINKENVLKKLNEQLPNYMIPNAIVQLPSFPLTPNKKIDRKQLSQYEISFEVSSDESKQSGLTFFERKISDYWIEILNLKQPVSLETSFFSIGGHSLSAYKLISLINFDLQLEVSLKNIFDYPTIRGLAAYLEKSKLDSYLTIKQFQKKDFYHLSPSQHPIWLASQNPTISVAYNMTAGYVLEGKLDEIRLTKAISKIIEKHEVLRTNFIEVESIPMQKINEYYDGIFKIDFEETEEYNLDFVVDEYLNQSFDLENEILIKAKLIQIIGGKKIFLFCIHHLIMDGYSLEIFIKEFKNNYNFDSESNTMNLELQFKDFSEKANEQLNKYQTRNWSFWNTKLEGYKSKVTFIKDFNPIHNNYLASKWFFELSTTTKNNIETIAAKNNLTINTVLITALNLLIYKFSNHKDVCVGTLNSSRINYLMSQQIGMFVKTLILRTQMNNDAKLSDLMKEIQTNLLEASHFDDIPYERLEKNIFDLLFVFQNPDFSLEDSISLEELKLETFPTKIKYCKVPILFNLYQDKDILKGYIEFNSELYSQDTIKLIAFEFCNILDGFFEGFENSLSSFMRSLNKSNKDFDFDFNF